MLTSLVEAENKALENLTRAQERLQSATDARAAAEDQPDVERAAAEFVHSMEELELDERVIRSAVRAKFGGKRTTRTDTGADLTDEVRAEMRHFVDNSGNEGFTTTALVEQFGVRRAQCTGWIKELVDAAEVTKTGTKRGTRYYLAGMEPEEVAA